jgi:hypothetical protein
VIDELHMTHAPRAGYRAGGKQQASPSVVCAGSSVAVIHTRSSRVSKDWKMAEAQATPPTWPTSVHLSCKINDDKMALLLVYLRPRTTNCNLSRQRSGKLHSLTHEDGTHIIEGYFV